MTRKHIASIAATVLAALAACYGMGWLTGEQVTVWSGFVIAVASAWGVKVGPAKPKKSGPPNPRPNPKPRPE